MSSFPFIHHFGSQIGKIPLRTVLVVPFVLQIFTTVGLVGYLSFRNGQKAVENLAHQLKSEITVRIKEKLNTYLELPHQINTANVDAIRLGLLTENNLNLWKYHFLAQINRSPSVNSIVWGNEKKGFVGIEVRDSPSLVEMLSAQSTQFNLETYAINRSGNRVQLISQKDDYDPRIRPWYRAAVEAKKPTWSKIFTQWETKTLTLAAVQPVYNSQGKLVGVVNASLHLNQVGNFLSNLKIGKSGQSFIIERDGMLVATSTGEVLAKVDPNTQTIERIKATDSQNEYTQLTADYIEQTVSQFRDIKAPLSLEFNIKNHRQFLQILPLQDQRGLDWLIVVVVPESDFMEQIHGNTRTTILLCVTALVVATILGILTTRWVTQPIWRLNAAASALSQGKLTYTLETNRTDELGHLTQAFNQMASQLKDSFAALEKTNAELEKRVEDRTAALRESEEKFSKAFRSSPNAITITRLRDQKYIEVNDSFSQMTGYRREEVINHTSEELNIWVYPQERDRLFEEVSNRGVIQNYEFSYYTKFCEIKTALMSTEIINLGGEECLLALSSDISDRKRSEEALRQAKEAADAANKAKSDFLANMSHELRTPLNAILGFSQLMNRSQNLTLDQQENLGIISRSGEHLLSLINQVLELSKIEAGRTILNEESFDLYCLLDDLEDMFRLRAEDKHLQLVYERSPELPQYVRADEVKLRQVLINLLNNAIKFTECGGVSLRVGLVKQTPESRQSLQINETVIVTENLSDTFPRQETITFEVEDTGPGIAAEELQTLFQAFVQTKTGKASQQGTGLGLAISQQFVKLMGGELIVSSIVDQGTMFKFDILVDVVKSQDIITKQPARRAIAIAPNQPQYRILIVDDRWTNRQLILKLLSPLGFEMREASNGLEAIQIWQSWNPHLIWMDMRMPVMDGYEATQRIKATTSGQATAIIALTASVFEEEKAVVLSAGCDDFMRKPFREADIFEMMHKHLGVQFIYDEDIDQLTFHHKESNRTSPLNADAFATLPAQLLVELEAAVTRIDMALIDTYIEEVRGYNFTLAEELANLAADFKYDEILNWFQLVKN